MCLQGKRFNFLWVYVTAKTCMFAQGRTCKAVVQDVCACLNIRPHRRAEKSFGCKIASCIPILQMPEGSNTGHVQQRNQVRKPHSCSGTVWARAERLFRLRLLRSDRSLVSKRMLQGRLEVIFQGAAELLHRNVNF